MCSDKTKAKTVRDLKTNYFKDYNPLAEGTVIKTKEKRICAGMRSNLIDPDTGEIQAVSSIQRTKALDDAEFVKVFADGVRAMYDLKAAGTRVFKAILAVYENTKMEGGYADTLYLPWFNGGIDGEDVGMSKRTFNRGLAELIEEGFLAPRSPDSYWVNPALFFKGDRVAFIKEYRRKSYEEKQLIK